MQWSPDWTTIVGRDSEQKLLFIVGLFGRFDEYVKVSAIVETSRVNETIFAVQSRAAPIFLDEVLVGEFSLGIFVEKFHV